MGGLDSFVKKTRVCIILQAHIFGIGRCGVRVRDTGFGSKRAHVDVMRRRHRASNLKKNTVVIRIFELYFETSSDTEFVFLTKKSYFTNCVSIFEPSKSNSICLKY